MVTKGSGNTFHIDRGAVPATIPYILKGYCQTRSILAEMCRLKEQDQWVWSPVVEIDLTAAVEHLYRRGCLLLWLSWVGICCRGRSGHGLQGEIRLYTGNQYSVVVNTGATARLTDFDCLLLGPSGSQTCKEGPMD